MTKHRTTLSSGATYVSPDMAVSDLGLESLLATSNTESMRKDDNEYPWDNN